MDTKFITITISDPIYQGFTYKIPLEYALNIKSNVIVNEMKKYMKNFFGYNNLVCLQEGIDKLNLHLHQDITHTDTVVYMCTRCSELEDQNKGIKTDGEK